MFFQDPKPTSQNQLPTVVAILYPKMFILIPEFKYCMPEWKQPG
jgi:hypothetical protein